MDSFFLKKLFYQYYDELVNFSVTFVSTKMIAEEIVQDVFIKVWQRGEQNIVFINPRSYLYKATKNNSINYLKSKYHQDHSGFLEIEGDFKATDLSSTFEHEELQQSIAKSVLKLPEKCRIIFILSRDQEMSYKEIAIHLDISKETVKSQIKIAIKKLKDYLTLDGFYFF